MSLEFEDQISPAETRVLDDLIDYVRGITVSTRKLNEMLSLWFGESGEMEKALKELIEMEKSSNELKHHLLNEISGRVLNIRRGDFMRLILSLSNIVDEIGGTGYRIKFISDWKCDKIVQDALKNISEKIILLVKTLKDIIFQLGKNTADAIKKVGLVGNGEREVDALRRDLMDHIYSIDIDYKTFTKIRDLINHYENIADNCEISGDLCRIIAVARRGSI